MSPEVQASAFRVLHLSACAFTAAFCWFALTTTAGPLAITAAAALVVLVVSWFLAAKGAARRLPRTLATWAVVFLASTHVALGYREGTFEGFRFDDTVGWLPKANLDGAQLEGPGHSYTVTTDSAGYRNRLPWPADGRLPVVLQGDSNAFGFGLEEPDTFCALWMTAGGEPCFNVGVSGFDPQHFYFQWPMLGPDARVGTRIILFNLGNDYALAAFDSPYLIPRPYLYLDGTEMRAVTDQPRPFRKQVYGHRFIAPYTAHDTAVDLVSTGRDWGRHVPALFAEFRLAAFLTEMVYPRLYGFYARTLPAEEQQARKRLNPYYPAWQLAPLADWPEPYKDFRRHFKALLAAIARQPAEETVVVLFPMRTQVIADEITSATAELERVDLTAMNRMVAEDARGAGMTVVDVTDTFRAHPDPRALFQSDYHLSPEGMRLVVATTRGALAPDRAPR